MKWNTGGKRKLCPNKFENNKKKEKKKTRKNMNFYSYPSINKVQCSATDGKEIVLKIKIK